MDDGEAVLVECAQGIDLDPYHGFAYPFVTSHGCTPAQALHDAGIAPQMVTRSIMVIRSYPIRVGHINSIVDGHQLGNSGPYGEETSFEALGVPAEFTTTTGRPRRVFHMDLDRLTHVANITRPTDIALTHADYIDAGVRGWNSRMLQYGVEIEGVKHGFMWPSNVISKLDQVARACKRQTAAPRVSLVKTGPRESDIVDTMSGW